MAQDLADFLNNSLNAADLARFVDKFNPLEFAEGHIACETWSPFKHPNAYITLPEFLPNKTNIVELDVVNPFARNLVGLYSGREKREVRCQKVAVVDGYLKFTFDFSNSIKNVPSAPRNIRASFGQTTLGTHHKEAPALNQRIYRLPQGFARAKLDKLDHGFLTLCKFQFFIFTGDLRLRIRASGLTTYC